MVLLMELEKSHEKGLEENLERFMVASRYNFLTRGGGENEVSDKIFVALSFLYPTYTFPSSFSSKW